MAHRPGCGAGRPWRGPARSAGSPPRRGGAPGRRRYHLIYVHGWWLMVVNDH